MFIDLTIKITPDMRKDAQGNEKKALTGHLGTHFDVMNKEFPLEYFSRKGVLFDVRKVKDRDIEIGDINAHEVHKDMFVMFYSDFAAVNAYGTKDYFKCHPQLSNELIEYLIQKKISIIGLDFAGIRRGLEHTPKDQYLADQGIFVVENLCNLNQLLKVPTHNLKINTYPVSYSDMTGLPCRVAAEI